MLLSMTSGCSRYVTVPPQEVAANAEAPILGFTVATRISGVTLLDGTEMSFDSSGGEYVASEGIIRGRTTDGEVVALKLKQLRYVQVSAPGPRGTLVTEIEASTFREGKTSWVFGRMRGQFMYGTEYVQFGEAGGRYDSTTNSISGISELGRPMEVSLDSVQSVRMKLLRSGQGRREIGLKGGANFIGFGGEPFAGVTTTTDQSAGFKAVLFGREQFRSWLALQSEIGLSRISATEAYSLRQGGTTVSVTNDMTLTFLDIAALGVFSPFRSGGITTNLYFGPTISISTSARTKYDSTSRTGGIVSGGSGEAEVTNVRSPLLGLTAGIELNYPVGRLHALVDIRYSHALNKVFEDGDYTQTPFEEKKALVDGSGVGWDIKTRGFSILAGLSLPF